MALNLKNKGKAGTTLISPPTAKSPDDSFFIGHKTFNDGRTVWWSRPQPDKLTIVGMLLLEHFTKVEETTKDLKGTVWSLKDELAGAALALGGTKFTPPNAKKLLLKARLPVGDRASPVFIQITQDIDTANQTVAYSMQMEMNPRKMGPAGFAVLWEVMKQAGEADFQFQRFLTEAWITRIDAAVDFAGVEPSELIVWGKIGKSAKRVEYYGEDGVLETLYLHKPKKPPKKALKKPGKPLGLLIVKAYDRNRERLARGKTPPYPGTAVTRLEVVKGFKKNAMPFWKMAHIPDLFQEVRLSYVGGVVQVDQLADLRTYVAFRRAYGPEAAAKLELPNASIPMAKRYEHHGSNLMEGLDFDGWEDGLAAVGMGPLIVAVGKNIPAKKATTK